MANARFLEALSRIEAAAGRLETLASRTPAGAHADDDLAERHARLRAGTAEALARLDRLIAAQPEA